MMMGGCCLHKPHEDLVTEQASALGQADEFPVLLEQPKTDEFIDLRSIHIHQSAPKSGSEI